jgi:polyhydroxyalkanoate synthesis regulator phasin
MKDLQEFLEKSMSFGLGLAAYSREKIEELVEEMVRKGEVAQKDARQFAGDLVQRGEEQRIEFKKLIHSEVTAILDKLDLIRKSDVQELIQSALHQTGSIPVPSEDKSAGTTASAETAPDESEKPE